jgi:hypothetical protein
MQATRAFHWAGDKLAIGAGGSFGASSNKGVGEINSFSGAGPATLPLSIVTSPLFSNWSGDDPHAAFCTKLTEATVRLQMKQPIACVHVRPHGISLCVCLPEWLGVGCGLTDTVHHNALITPSYTMLHLALDPQHSMTVATVPH